MILTLKDDTDDEKYGQYLSEWTLKDLVTKYSDYIRYPITMQPTPQVQVYNSVSSNLV